MSPAEFSFFCLLEKCMDPYLIEKILLILPDDNDVDFQT
jgi:hypothetical protein